MPRKLRGRHVRAIAEVVDPLTRPAFAKRGMVDGALVRDWPVIVGPVLAAQSAPVRVAYRARERREGTLLLRVVSGSLAAELQHLEPLVVERVNGYFGYRAVARLRLLQGPLEPREASIDEEQPQPDPAIDRELTSRLGDVEDAELRQALHALGRRVRARRS